MEEVTLTEPETRFYSELFLCCDVEKTGKVPMLKATELFRSADIANEAVIEITALAGIPSAALHISRAQFYSCLKLIAAHQAAMPLRQELVAATVQLPLPHFSWKEAPTAAFSSFPSENGLSALPPPPPTDRRNSLQRRRSSSQKEQQQDTSDVPSTDSEVEQNESSCGGEFDEAAANQIGSTSSRETRRRGVGASPEAWSTNSDSPTPTNSVAERPWAQDTLWQGLLGDEHRQLLGTEEESSDRHSSDDEDNERELVTLYQITTEQRDYYFKQFKAVQRDPHGLLSGQAARVFFEKSRIPVEELRHIWQLCDVTRDGALSLAEFTAAMHLVVLRRNNIPLPSSLPHCLHPNVLRQHIIQEPPEADLLHLNDDDEEEDQTDNTIVASKSGGKAKNIMNLSSISNSSSGSRRDATSPSASASTAAAPPPLPPAKHRSISNSPAASTPAAAPAAPVDASNAAASQWTKFSESPTTTSGAAAAAAAAAAIAASAVVVAGASSAPAVSSPGLKPALFDMKRTAQDVGSNPQILHPVPLRVTPIGSVLAAVNDAPQGAASSNDNDSGEASPKLQPSSSSSTANSASNNNNSNSNNNQAASQSNTITTTTTSTTISSLREQSSDLRAIQRPQAKKLLPAKNIGALPPPPQREPSSGATEAATTAAPQQMEAASIVAAPKKEPPPLPPPRPHRHARSSSLDLNKFKVGHVGAQQEITAQASFDMQTSAGFADFTHFADEASDLDEQQQLSLPPAPPPPGAGAGTGAGTSSAVVPPTRISLTQTQQRVSAFEVYRKPQTPRNSQSPPLPLPLPLQQPTQPPPPAPFGAIAAAAMTAQTAQLPSAESFEKRVSAISDSLRHVSFKQKDQSSTTELLQRLREQNNSLLHLCNDLSDELLSVQTRKEEMRLKLESVAAAPLEAVGVPARTVSSISAPVTANVTGGSSGSSANV